MTTTLNESEVDKFTRIADEWWDVNGKFKPLHQINPLRLEFITKNIADNFAITERKSKYLNGLSVLDIGCGGGLLCEPMARLGADVTGVDASEKNIKVASLHAEKQGIKINYLHSTVEKIVDNSPKFDVILNMEVIEHVDNPDFFIKTCAQLLKPQGIMFVATLNRTIKSLLLAKIGAEYILRWLPRGTHDWNKFLRPSELEAMLHNAGLNLNQAKGMTFNPLSQTWRLSDDLSVNYLLSTRFIVL